MKIGIDVGTKRLINNTFVEKGRDNVILWEVLDIEDGDLFEVTFLKRNSSRKQGVWFATDKGIEVNGNLYKQIDLWEDTAPKKVVLKCFTDVGKLSFYNIWDKGNGKQSQAFSSGMILEEKDNCRTYFCNDFGLETNFDTLVFAIRKVAR